MSVFKKSLALLSGTEWIHQIDVVPEVAGVASLRNEPNCAFQISSFLVSKGMRCETDDELSATTVHRVISAANDGFLNLAPLSLGHGLGFV
jgi:hypothetical protein